MTYFVRVAGVVLLAVYVVALGLKLVLDLRAPDGPRGIRYVAGRAPPLSAVGAAVLLAAVAYAAIKARQGVGLESGLGAYGGVVKVEYDLSNASSWVVDHFAELALSVARDPRERARRSARCSRCEAGRPPTAERAFLAVAASAFVLVVIEVGIFASRFSLRIEERNMFSVAPLLFLAFALWLARGLPRPLVPRDRRRLSLLPRSCSTLDLKSLLQHRDPLRHLRADPAASALGLVGGGVDTVEVLLWVGGLAAALAFVLLPQRSRGRCAPAGVALFLVLSSYAIYGAVRDHSKATLALTTPSTPSWVDEEIGTDAHAAYIYGSTADLVGEAQIMWQTEFWNRSLDKVFTVGPPEPAPLAETPAALDPGTGRIAAPGPVPYAVVPSTLELAGALLDLRPPLALYRVAPPLRLASRLDGVYRDGWMGADASYTRYGASPGRRARSHSRAGPGTSPALPRRSRSAPSPSATPSVATDSKTWTVGNGAEPDVHAEDAEAAVPGPDPRDADVLAVGLRRGGHAAARRGGCRHSGFLTAV